MFNAIDDSWTGGQGNIQAVHQVTGTTSLFNLSSPTQTLYAEKEGMAAWGSVVLATSHSGSSTVSYQSGTTSTLYTSFVGHGHLDGQNPTFEAGDSVAFAHDLGKVSASTSVTFAVGQYRLNVVDYLGQAQAGYHVSKYANVLAAVDGFLGDYNAAYQKSQSLDKQIQQASGTVSSKYSDLTAAAVRQMWVKNARNQDMMLMLVPDSVSWR